MARKASGKEVLAAAKESLARDRAVGELRQAQAVILPLEFGFSLEQESLRGTSYTRNLILPCNRNGKKFPESLALIKNQWSDSRRIRVVFQDEARFRRISDTRGAGVLGLFARFVKPW